MNWKGQCTGNTLTLWRRGLLEKPPVVQPLDDSSAFYGTRRFITVFTRALDWSQSWARSIQSILSHPVSLRFILILSTHLYIDFHSSLFPSGFHSNSIYTFCFAPFMLHALPIAFFLTLNILIILGEEHQLWISLLYSFLHDLYCSVNNYIFFRHPRHSAIASVTCKTAMPKCQEQIRVGTTCQRFCCLVISLTISIFHQHSSRYQYRSLSVQFTGLCDKQPIGPCIVDITN
jgi:hypothetical protein